MNLPDERDLSEQIINHLPANEEELAIALGATREQIESSCALLHRQHKIQLDRSWDSPRHWELAREQ